MAEAALDLPEIDIELPEKLAQVFSGPARYRGARGGRGSGKSRGFALMAAVRALSQPTRFLCAREFQTSIRESVHQEIVEAIEEHGLASAFEYGESFIRCPATGSEFIFKGLRRNHRQIKSLAGVDVCWIEEAEAVPEQSWRVLIPTIRKPGSEIWLTWNPESKDSATDRRFVQNPPEDARIVEMNFDDNPWFPPELEKERIRDMAMDPDLYAHVWEGGYYTRTDAQVLAGKWKVEEFEPGPDWDGPYYGLDWGFSQDPTAAVEVWRHGGRLYVRREAGRVRLDLNDTGRFMRERIPGIERNAVRADNARPESISHVAKHPEGLPRLVPVKKWPGSVEDGIEHIRSYEVMVIHPSCKETAREARLYSTKVTDAGDVTDIILDAWNHYIDAIRYALAPLIRKRNAWGAA